MPLTHAFLSLMLGVLRAGAREALQSLKRENLIDAERGPIVVLNRMDIERRARESDGLPEAEYHRLGGMDY